MAGKVKTDKIKIGVKKPVTSTTDLQKTSGKTSGALQVSARFYDLNTEQPLPLDVFKSRITQDFLRREKLAAQNLIDLFFLSANKSFYGLEGRFEVWIHENLPFHRTYAYKMIKIVDILMEYTKGKFQIDLSESMDKALEFIEKAVETVGMKKLVALSQVVEERREEVIDHVFAGEIKTADEIEQLNKEYKREMAEEKPKKVEASVEAVEDDSLTVSRKKIEKQNGKYQLSVEPSGEVWLSIDNSPKMLGLTFDRGVNQDFIDRVTDHILKEFAINEGKIWRE
jgi:hypothetical protein